MEHIRQSIFKRPKSSSRERGQALLEFVPVIIILLTMTLAMVDLGRAIWQLQVISALTREGSNLASRNTTLSDSAAAVISDGSVLNLSSQGRVIITSVMNVGGTTPYVVTGQYISPVGIKAGSKIVTNPGNKLATIQNYSGMTTQIPPLNDTVYVTEIYSSYSPITPVGAFVNFINPMTLYDVAYF